MAQMTPEVSRLLEQALSLSVEEREALAESLISNLDGKVDEGVQAAWEAEIGKRIADLDSGKAKTTTWAEVRKRNLAKLPRAHWYQERSVDAALKFDSEMDRALRQIKQAPQRWVSGSPLLAGSCSGSFRLF